MTDPLRLRFADGKVGLRKWTVQVVSWVFIWAPQKQEKKPCSFYAPSSSTYAKPSIFNCRHNPSPSVAMQHTKSKGLCSQGESVERCHGDRLFTLTTLQPPPPPPPPPPVTLSRFPHHPQPGADDDSERRGKKSVVKEKAYLWNKDYEKVRKKTVKCVWFHSDNCPFYLFL